MAAQCLKARACEGCRICTFPRTAIDADSDQQNIGRMRVHAAALAKHDCVPSLEESAEQAQTPHRIRGGGLARVSVLPDLAVPVQTPCRVAGQHF